jgi:RNA polymerase sigma-70 factor, ECF subfamily
MSSKLHRTFDLSLPASLTTDEATAPQAVQHEVLRLFDECSPRLRRYVGSFGLKPDAIEDVVQDVYLSLFRHLQLGRPRHNLRGWLFQVAHNLALKQRHRTKRQHAEPAVDGLIDQLVDPAANPEERMASDQRRRRLRAVLRAMRERDRQCLYLRAEGLVYRDIARALGISLGSVAKSLTRAFRRLMHADAR